MTEVDLNMRLAQLLLEADRIGVFTGASSTVKAIPSDLFNEIGEVRRKLDALKGVSK
jgi:hypothetical protein